MSTQKGSVLNPALPAPPSTQLDLFGDAEAARREQRAAQAPCLFDLDQVGYFARLGMAEDWNRTYGDARSIGDAHAWTPCVTQTFNRAEPTPTCRPTILLADLRCEHYRTCSCVGDLLYRGACFACTWEGPAGDSENAAAEDAHDHAWPGWRDLPLVPRRPEAGTSTKQKTSMARWIDSVDDLYPPGWLAAGGPIRTARAGVGTRHVPNHTGFGGYDLCGDTAGPQRQP